MGREVTVTLATVLGRESFLGLNFRCLKGQRQVQQSNRNQQLADMLKSRRMLDARGIASGPTCSASSVHPRTARKSDDHGCRENHLWLGQGGAGKITGQKPLFLAEDTSPSA